MSRLLPRADAGHFTLEPRGDRAPELPPDFISSQARTRRAQTQHQAGSFAYCFRRQHVGRSSSGLCRRITASLHDGMISQVIDRRLGLWTNARPLCRVPGLHRVVAIVNRRRCSTATRSVHAHLSRVTLLYRIARLEICDRSDILIFIARCC